MEKNSKIYIAGHTGLVGSAILNNLKQRGYTNLITRTHQQLDLVACDQVAEFFQKEQPEYVFLAAAKVGGIKANNTYRAEFIYENLMIQTNVIHHSYLKEVKKLMFLGSTCIYPDNCPQPIKEEYLLTGKLEYTNEPYAIAKIAGMKMCESYNLQYGCNFISVMPTNLFGPADNFDLEKSHVIPALIRKIYLGKALSNSNWTQVRRNLTRIPIEGITGDSTEEEILAILEKYGVQVNPEGKVKIEIWGSGKPMREFLWSEDMADACVYLMRHVQFEDIVDQNHGLPGFPGEIRNTHINLGTGEEISIAALAYLIKRIIGFDGELFFNSDKPDGTLRKVTDCSKLKALGWNPKMSVAVGIERIHNEMIDADESFRKLEENQVPLK